MLECVQKVDDLKKKFNLTLFMDFLSLLYTTNLDVYLGTIFTQRFVIPDCGTTNVLQIMIHIYHAFKKLMIVRVLER